EKKITLPLLYVISNSDPAERRRILRLIKRKNKNPAVVQEIIGMVKEKGGLDYATKKMNEFRDNAVNALMEFPESEARNSLIELMDYITTRQK
ncbi:MAG: polyprenyl synthetase family protein, partial [Prolixibacteraceae bacterium]|nr:polyprenyl synthetase family protein [Prolixibacteraceae bacterium]